MHVLALVMARFEQAGWYSRYLLHDVIGTAV